MSAPPDPGPLCPPLAEPVIVSDDEAYVVPCTVSPKQAGAIAHDGIRNSVFRPEDIGAAEIAPVRLLYVPFWRFHVEAEGFHIGFSSIYQKDAGIRWSVPLPGRRHKEAVLLIEGRRLFPFLPKLHGVGELSAKITRAFTIEREQMEPRVNHAHLFWERAGGESWGGQSGKGEGEVVEPDVTRDSAAQQALRAIMRAARPEGAIYSTYEPRVLSAACVHYPLYLVTYSYQGHAGKPGQRYYVTVSGSTAKVVAQNHPSAVRSLARKFRNLFTT